MPILPDFVRILLVAYLDPILHWVSAEIYAELLKRAGDHFLLDLHATLDFAPLEAACATFHHQTGPGTRPTHPTPRLVRALLIGALFGWSLRQLEFQIRFHVVIKCSWAIRSSRAAPTIPRSSALSNGSLTSSTACSLTKYSAKSIGIFLSNAPRRKSAIRSPCARMRLKNR